MAIVDCQAVVEQVRQLTHDVRELTFRLREPVALDFVAGQYLNFRVPAPDKPKPVSRLYSIDSAPSERGIVRLVYNYVGGPGTAFLQGLAVGGAVHFKAPFGHFVLQAESTRDILMVATGTGIVPFRSMLQEHLAAGMPRTVTLLWGVRSQRDLYYQDELAALAQRYTNFRFLMTLSQPEAGWSGLKGRVTAIFPEYFPAVDALEVYACGSDTMIVDVKALCEARGGCPFYREKYF